MKKFNIAIDGPASSGKSTVAKILAKKLDFIYIDTGAMYRSVTYLALKHHVALNNQAGLVELIEQYPIRFKQGENGQLVFIEEKDCTLAIRQPEVTNAVSEVSAQALVREKLVFQQQEMAEDGGVVMDGRDIGTQVLPRAEVKIFLIASVTERAERRYKENIENGIETPFDILKTEIEKRDFLDSTREVSPLKQAEDAVLLDTTGLTIPQVVEKIEEIVTDKGF
ncbi:(d)CMP kinase [Enterococcus sp. HY326]|uniref:(d)CMP kinase n=1 Tax=Enterococcus sp. HY326 TaxID=2971265 RepID=UPI00223F375F|nr:(d)CMP kinase [Enterococcus sp. HY326]